MENYTLILIVITNIFIVLILGIFTFFIYRLLKQQNAIRSDFGKPSELGSSHLHPEILERFKEAEKHKPRRAELFCPNHPDEPGETTCAICDRLYCRACIKPFKSLHFCKEHMPLVMRHDWEEVMTIKTSTTDPEHGVRLYDRKKELFQKEDLPTYVETHYKINVDQDYIETYLVLFSMKEKLDEVKNKFSGLAQKEKGRLRDL